MNVDSNEPASKMFKNDIISMEQIEVNEMTSKDYYFDSYAHFGIHEGKHFLYVKVLILNTILLFFFVKKC